MQSKSKFAGLSDQERLKKLLAMPDEDIDYSDIPNMGDTSGWKKLYPKANKDTIITDKMMFEALARVLDKEEADKVPVTLKLDRKVIDFFKKHSKKYQVKINEVLLTFVQTYQESHSH
jgi:uncharacterized protein (DUF4415 family)